jgi:hypothetical protein
VYLVRFHYLPPRRAGPAPRRAARRRGAQTAADSGPRPGSRR